MLNHLSSDNPDSVYLNQLADEFGDLHRDLKLLTIDFYLKLKSISSEEEQEQLYRYFNNILNKDDSRRKFKNSRKRDSDLRKREKRID